MVLVSDQAVLAGTSAHFDYSFYQKVLHDNLDERGLVNYSQLKAEGTSLSAHLQQLARVSPENQPELFRTKQSQLAYWLNTYNAFVLKAVVDSYPTRSVRSIKYFYGFFWRIKFEAGGRTYTLRHIENEIIRKQYGDPRVHFVLVFASVGCPRLWPEVFVPEKLDAQLEAATRAFINENRNVRIDPAQGRLWLSKIFARSWYEGDFLYWYSQKFPGSRPTIRDYLKLYLSPERKRLLETLPDSKPLYFDHDWSLNDQALYSSGHAGL